jgi:folate-binding protein YgfZ
MVSVPSPGVLEQYDAARRGAAIIDRSDRGRITISGNDRASYLQGLLTNDIVALSAGEGCYAAYLTPQGRMISDVWVYELGDEILLTLGRDVKDAVLTRLDQSIFTEDVQIRDSTDSFTSVAVVGPAAADTLSSVLEGRSASDLAALAEHASAKARFNDHAAIVLRVTDTGEPGYELLVDREDRTTIMSAVAEAGAVPIDAGVAETLRVEAGIPRFHRDMDEQTIPLEAGIETSAISFTKGCFVGQEVIVRVLHRGHGRVARKLVGITLERGAPAPAGTLVHSEGRDVGRVTSSVASPAVGRPVALAYVTRDLATPGTVVTVDDVPGTVTPLPFVAGRLEVDPTA